ncbi:MAG: hypothetical protein IJP78_03480 [Clostridia bacterium]|nr:hypothetical protein [Clostridia bacterium]
MKKLVLSIALMLTISPFFCSVASADVITALAAEINPEHLEKTASYARILGYNEKENTLTVELIVPEIFSWEDVEALKVGDSIYTDGREVTIETIAKQDYWGDYIKINDGSVNLSRCSDGSGDFAAVSEWDDAYTWIELAVIECPVKDSLLFLDYINDETGNMLELPVVHTARELTTRLLEEDADQVYNVGLTASNVYVVFDGEGNLATIHRFYVPWQ